MAVQTQKEVRLKPLGNRVVIQPLEAEERTASGIVIPDSAKEKQQRGKVVAIGTGKKTEDGKVIPLDLKVGDEVLYGKYSGTEIKVGGNELLVLSEDDVLGIIHG